MGFIKFLFKSVDATIETKKTVKDISNNASYCNGLFTDDIVSPDAFLKMYNMRSYDFYSGQSDIKFMKTIDFPGAYIIHNNNTGIYYVQYLIIQKYNFCLHNISFLNLYIIR